MDLILNVRKAFPFLALAAYMGLIFYLSSIPLELPEIAWDPSKFTLHIFEYIILGFLSFNALRKSSTSFLLSSIYGITDEFHQSFVPTRTFSFSDMAADVIGSFLGVVLCFLLLRKIGKKRE